MAKRNVAIIVAHPDDETLWAGGTILLNTSWKCFVVCLCRGNDKDRAQKFYKALKQLNSKGAMGDLDDGPEQEQLEEKDVEDMIIHLLTKKHFDLIISHNPFGEYTRHIRHEATGRAVIKLWSESKISTDELWIFAYEDGGKEYLPRPVENTPVHETLTMQIWQKKYSIITKTYGFEKDSWEAETTPKAESFWQFTNPQDAKRWIKQVENEKI